MMKIVIDIQSLRHTRVGLPTVAYNLVKSLIPLMVDDELILLNNSYKKGAENKPDIPPHENTNVTYRNLKLSRKVLEPLWNTLRFPKLETLIGRFDVYHSPTHGELPLTRAKKVLTIHDLYFMKGDFFPRADNERLRNYFVTAAKASDVVIADSDATRDDVIELLGMSPERVKRVYLAAHETFRPIGDREAVAEVCTRHGLNGDFIFFVGGLTTIKNVLGIVKAYNIFRARGGSTLPLALGGVKGERHEEIFAEINASQFKRDIRYLGYIPEKDLPYLMYGAAFFVYPSFFEGFGLPVLEAMSCGTPVITSNRSSTAEIAGDAALLVTPENVEEIADAMTKLSEDAQLRALLSEKGIRRNAEFSWEKCAKETLNIYRSLV